MTPALPFFSLLLAAQPAPTARFALVVTYNGGPELSVPPLHYADDDGAKYFEVFAALDTPENVELLTEFDPDSARLFPALVKLAQPPTEDNVRAAAAALGARVKAAKGAGYATELTFVFAGHGDVDHGRGFVSLKGASLDGDGLTGLLDTVGADRDHVILDSCNSFFVLSPRGAGRRFSTAADISDKLKRDLPNVGLFLSTNAEAEVFEWSALQSGVFSHAVRSGLLGAADADGDGVVTYEELAAFVDRATQDLKNPLFRPKVFARGPGGDGAAELADLQHSALVPLRIDDPGEVRLSIRDSAGLRWIDAHKEAGAALVLHLPPFLAAAGTIERIDSAQAGTARGPVLAFADPAGTPLTLSALGPRAPALSPRGTDELMAGLFAEPFGPIAYQRFVQTQESSEAPVYGIGAKEKERMQLLLTEIAAEGKSGRQTAGGLLLGAATLEGLFGAYYVYTGRTTQPLESPTAVAVNGGLAGGFMLLFAVQGIGDFIRPSEEERALARFLSDLGNPHLGADQVVAHADAALESILESQHRHRLAWEGLGWVFGAIGLGAAVVCGVAAAKGGANFPDNVSGVATGGVVGVAGAAVGLYFHFTQSATERLIRIWRSDEGGLALTGLSVAPITLGNQTGAAFALSGRF